MITMPTLYIKATLYDEIIKRGLDATEYVNRVVEATLLTGEISKISKILKKKKKK